MKKQILLFVVLCLLLSCGGQKKTLTSRFKKYEIIDNSSGIPHVSIEAFSYPTKIKSELKNIFNLSERAQKELIRVVSKNGENIDNLHSKLGMSIKPKTQAKTIEDRTFFDRTVVFSVENEDNIIGSNRIQRIEISMYPKDSTQMEFVSWDKLATKYGTFDLGKITSSDTSSFSISPAFGP